MDADLIRGYLEFYQDLGIKTLYRRAAPVGEPEAQPEAGGTACPTNDQPEPIMGEALPQILADIGDCRRCRLHEGRHNWSSGRQSHRAAGSSWVKAPAPMKMPKAFPSWAAPASCSRR